MAEMKGGLLGKPSGKVGDMVYRIKNKKVLAYRLNETYNKSFSDKALENESLFTKVSAFANFLNKSPLLKQLWILSKRPGVYSNLKIYKFNHRNIKLWGISSEARILPTNFTYRNKNVILDKNKLTLEFQHPEINKLYKNQTHDFEPPYTFVSVIYAVDPVNPESEQKKAAIYLDEKVDDFKISAAGTSRFTFDTPENSFPFLNDFKTILVFPAIVSHETVSGWHKWAECGGIYMKGSIPKKSLFKPEPVPVKPNKTFIIDY